MNHRCAIHPCRADAEPGHSTCPEHREHQADLHARYAEHIEAERSAREQQAAEAQATAEWRARAGITARAAELVKERRASRGAP